MTANRLIERTDIRQPTASKVTRSSKLTGRTTEVNSGTRRRRRRPFPAEPNRRLEFDFEPYQKMRRGVRRTGKGWDATHERLHARQQLRDAIQEFRASDLGLVERAAYGVVA